MGDEATTEQVEAPVAARTVSLSVSEPAVLVPLAQGAEGLLSGRTPPGRLLALQRAAGNRAARSLARRDDDWHPPLQRPAPAVTSWRAGSSWMVLLNGGSIVEALVRPPERMQLVSDWEPTTGTLRITVRLPKVSSYELVADVRERLTAAAPHWRLRIEREAPVRRGESLGPESELQVVEELDNGALPDPARPAPSPGPAPARDDAPRLVIEEAPDAERIDSALQAMREGRWDSDDLAARLTTADMTSLSPFDRAHLIGDVADGYLVGDEDEDTIIRLLDTTPPQDAVDLLPWLLAGHSKLFRRLDRVIDGDNYRRYAAALSRLVMGGMDPAELQAAMSSAPILPWTGPGLVKGAIEGNHTYELAWEDDGRIRVDHWVPMVGPMQMQVEALHLQPTQLVRVQFMRDDPEAGGVAGQSIYMPAVAFWQLYHSKFRRDMWLAVQVALLVSGPFSAAGAATTLGRVLGGIDVAVGAAGLAIGEYRAEIARTEAGRTFLSAWDVAQTVISVYGVARALRAVPGAVRDLRDAWRAYRATVAGQQASASAEAAKRMWLNMSKLEQELEEAERAGAGATNSAAALAKLEAEFRAEIRRLRETLVKLPQKDSGPVLSGCLNTKTGEIFYGVNQGRVPQKIHPLLKARYEAYMKGTGGITPEKAGIPGAHSEVGALNKALWARDPAGKLTKLPEGEFVMHNAQLYRNRPEGVPPKCDNCMGIIPPEIKFLP